MEIPHTLFGFPYLPAVIPYLVLSIPYQVFQFPYSLPAIPHKVLPVAHKVFPFSHQASAISYQLSPNPGPIFRDRINFPQFPPAFPGGTSGLEISERLWPLAHEELPDLGGIFRRHTGIKK